MTKVEEIFFSKALSDLANALVGRTYKMKTSTIKDGYNSYQTITFLS